MAFRVQITDDPTLWVEFFASQTGGNGFVGDPFQRGGFALGGLFKGLARMVLPVIKKAGKAVGKQALKTGVAVAQDALAGRNVGEAFDEHGRVAAAKLLNKAVSRKQPRRRRQQQKGGRLTYKAGDTGLVKLRKRRQKTRDALGPYFI